MAFRTSLRHVCRLRRASGAMIIMGMMTALILPAGASTINGTISFAPELGNRLEKQQEKRLGKQRRFFWRVPNGAVRTLDPRIDPASQFAVVLEPVGTGGTPPAGQPKVVKLQGGSLNPAAIVITPHTKVRFRNSGAFVYELSCQENPQMAQGQKLPPGNQIDIPFDEPGIYPITDRRHPYLFGWVVVVNTALAKNPSPGKAKQASFSFEDVQAGTYKAKVFFSGEWVAEKQVEVGEDDDEVAVEINLPAKQEQQEQEQGEDADAEAEQ